MKITKSVLLVAALLASSAAVAYSPEELEKGCHKPKFTDFTGLIDNVTLKNPEKA